MSAGKRGGDGSDGGAGVLVALHRTMSLVVDRLNEEKERSPCLGDRPNGNITMWGAQRRILLDVLMACWGLGTWLGVNGLYVQLPLLVERLPEGWALPSSMTVAIQLANVGLIAYAVLRRLFPRAPDAPYIYILLVIGTVALYLNSFLYTETAMIGGTERSFSFLALTFFAALVGCTSSVLFYPYLRHFRDVYLATYLVGEGLSGFIPSILALIQGIGGAPECVYSPDNSTVTAIYPPARFNSTVFLILLGCLSALSLVSFAFVDNCSAFLSERVKESEAAKEEEATTELESIFQLKWVSVLVLMAFLNALMNGALPSVQTYSCMPYGTNIYHLAVTLGSMANPAACLAGVWLRPVSSRVLAAMLTFVLLPLGYIFATAALSPTPPLYSDTTGRVLVVLSWVAVSGLVSYARMWVYGWARRGGAGGMRACGAATQVGSALGSLAFFFIVNYGNVFTQPDACPTLSS
ncbi:solute carrier family 52, riboflavin transporter, member 3-B isoform X1 [Vanessa cardui]|uniref:solute carrier family 52, riboflavin transporter, member 3-B isoform X1 n=2 Tax=Vanessa cardui TaxID=171605 RepID=UPI001F1342F5|nr:solute carrier family 52, riboflavin transporter, member 3-B isoform X1 [Vanessa cardui]XP_046962174.1 solute carrier family 52, riboflavin transporter, member 3-B isoform X1 [Vanessa cardui]XP_046962175.1 solute carrier family 52, riboflavin transporter, member 3-B isoform X1 [Vanessa cardui]